MIGASKLVGSFGIGRFLTEYSGLPVSRPLSRAMLPRVRQYGGEFHTLHALGTLRAGLG